MTTRYINTASTPGGNGTTNDTVGANRAYAGIAEWEAAEQVVLADDHEVWCEGATTDTAVTIDGWTPGSFKITVRGNTTTNGKHAGIYSNTKYRIEAAAGTTGLIQALEEKTVVRDFILYNTGTGNSTFGAGPTGEAVEVLNMVVRGGVTGTGIGIAMQDINNLRVRVKNCIVYDHGAEGIYVRQNAAGTGDALIINNTVVDCGTGIRARAASTYIQAWNNLSFSNTSDWVDGGFDIANSEHNAFGNTGAACPGATDIDLSTYVDADVYLDPVNDNFHLASAGSAYSLLDNDGVGPSSNADVPVDDIDGDARSGTTTSVGADFVSSGTSIAVTDNGSGVDGIGNIAVGLAITDSGAGTDAGPSPLAEFTISDSGSGVDTLMVAVAAAISDVGVALDALSVSASIALTDTGTGVDGPTVSVNFVIADAGAGTDLLSVLQETLISIADDCAGADTISVSVSVPVADAGSGIDQVSLAALLQIIDAASGTEVVIRFDAATRIATVTFSLARRSAEFILMTRSMAFSFARREIAFQLN